MKKIICLKGGLGNQMFEYCHYDALRRALGESQVALYYDRRRLKAHGGVELADCFDIRLPGQRPAVVAAVAALKCLRAMGLARRLWDDEDPAAVLIDDYSQHRRFLPGARGLFSFSAQVRRVAAHWAERLAAEAYPVAVHYRRGDYLLAANIGNFGTCPPEYYRKACSLMLGRHPEASFFIFSDDTGWAKANTGLPGATVVDHGDGVPNYADLYLMTLCRGHIIANSTFSFWGAYLGPQGGTNIYPRRWYAADDWITPDIFPPTTDNWFAV